MARFYGSLKGQRGEATRLGTPSSGLTVKASGWDIGGRVTMDVDPEGRDRVSFEVTHGSNGSASSVHLITFVKVDGKLVPSVPGVM